ncbi:MAG: hypothetical protein A2161_10345 [Candidatus Schekmanbacteria bacterium RBG_13_48_7]|uniref:Uncharacterized protein n=1 Tax=Candidatus Schekmanbacteria bacterium RBG_13_48_7 TaxID=1817878 RepID=A0A1F7S0N2_9BACT|nr:MAG: hypothetical protein A2161_10345 [Candidatus Schekmanbacteria bacterium RBG_13_48_7]
MPDVRANKSKTRKYSDVNKRKCILQLSCEIETLLLFILLMIPLKINNRSKDTLHNFKKNVKKLI